MVGAQGCTVKPKRDGVWASLVRSLALEARVSQVRILLSRLIIEYIDLFCTENAVSLTGNQQKGNNMYYGNDKELEELLGRSVELTEVGYYDYDWDRFASFYDPITRKFYWVEGSGCSCNDLWDDIRTVGDMCVGSKKELLKAATEFCGGGYKDEFENLRREVSKIKD